MSHLILLPTDFSDYARMTADMVPDLPGPKEVILLHVLEGAHASSRPFIGGHEFASSQQNLQNAA